MRIHIVGIAGTMTAPLASELKRLDNIVTGSDQAKIYPPVSTILAKAKITPNKFPVDKKINLAIIGSSYKAFSNTIAEYQQIISHKIPHISATKYIAKYIARKESILVAGSFGKTTITSILVWIFKTAKYDPSYMVAGESKNPIAPIHISSSQYSILEADESINGLDTKAKFLYYPVKYLLLTSAAWEHKDSYHTSQDNFNAFETLVKKVPKNGLIVCSSTGENVTSLIKSTQSRVVTYGQPDSNYYLESATAHPNNTRLTIHTPQGQIHLSTHLIGDYNFQNITAAVALSMELGINLSYIKKAINSYRGVKRRLEKVADTKDIIFYDDFAQAPNRVASVIETLSARYPTRPLKIFFEPHASFLAHRSSLAGFNNAFLCTSEVIIGKIPFKPDIFKDDRVTAREYTQEIGGKCKYIPLHEDIFQHFTQSLQPQDILVHFSSGGLDGLKTLRRIINYFKKQNSN